MLMHCPNCKEPILQRVLLPGDLPAYECKQCRGAWLSSNEYLVWLGGKLPAEANGPPKAPELPAGWKVVESSQARICPECGRFLRRYPVWPDTAFFLDRCTHCNGIWFDMDEWQVLQAQQLYNRLNLIFTKPWQHKLRREEMQHRMEKLYLERFGAQDYAEVQRIKAWLAHHPQRSSLLAYLLEEDPDQ